MNAEQIISHYGMVRHPEGGAFIETYRSIGSIAAEHLTDYPSERNFSTGILFLLQSGEYSKLHRIRQDEMWHFYLGGPLRVVEITPEGLPKETILGTDILAGQVVQYVVRGGNWFGATPCKNTDYALVGCTVAPGFDFEDFELGRYEDLYTRFPKARKLIQEFCLSD